MQTGLVGLPGVGKTTLLDALTGSKGHHDGGGLKPHVGTAPIPDPRLAVIAEHIESRKIVNASLTLVDIPGVPPGSDSKKLNAFLEHVRQVDALCHVVRCFDDGGGVDPTGDIDTMDTELVLADLVVVEGARDRLANPAKAGDRDATSRMAVLDKLAPVLDEGRSVRSIEGLNDAERAVIRSYGLVTAKPVLFVANVPEDDITGEGDAAQAVRAHARSTGAESVTICAKLEAELAELDPSDRDEMLGSMGLSEPAIGPMARGLLSILGYSCFYTAGEKEIRAWPIPAGATAPESAGTIHSDIQRGFIRAECYTIDDLVQHKSEKAIREAGRLRSEGKNYEMQDGDVVHFLFNV